MEKDPNKKTMVYPWIPPCFCIGDTLFDLSDKTIANIIRIIVALYKGYKLETPPEHLDTEVQEVWSRIVDTKPVIEELGKHYYKDTLVPQINYSLKTLRERAERNKQNAENTNAGKQARREQAQAGNRIAPTPTPHPRTSPPTPTPAPVRTPTQNAEPQITSIEALADYFKMVGWDYIDAEEFVKHYNGNPPPDWQEQARRWNKSRQAIAEARKRDQEEQAQ